MRTTPAVIAAFALLLPAMAVPARGGENVAAINARLDRFVHRTQACGGDREWLATYYERGTQTANGERFRPDGLTAAVKKRSGIPFGALLTVCNPKSGRCVQVRVNDRGPATHADIDLSRGAARAIGMRQSIYVCIR